MRFREGLRGSQGIPGHSREQLVGVSEDHWGIGYFRGYQGHSIIPQQIPVDLRRGVLGGIRCVSRAPKSVQGSTWRY